MKEEIYLTKVIQLFRTEGLSLSMEEIADKIGVTKKTLYNHFENKDELIRKSLEKVLEDFRRSVDCTNDTSKDVRECFRNGFDAMRNFFREMSPVFLNDMLKYDSGLVSGDHAMGSKYFIDLLQKNIERGQAENIYRKDIDAPLMANYIAFSALAFFRKSVMMENNSSAGHYFSQVIEFNLKALSN